MSTLYLRIQYQTFLHRRRVLCRYLYVIRHWQKLCWEVLKCTFIYCNLIHSVGVQCLQQALRNRGSQNSNYLNHTVQETGHVLIDHGTSPSNRLKEGNIADNSKQAHRKQGSRDLKHFNDSFNNQSLHQERPGDPLDKSLWSYKQKTRWWPCKPVTQMLDVEKLNKQ